MTKGLICSKSRIAKRNLTIPRPELVSGHMTVNLAINVQQALTDHHATVHCWLDSMVALYWINEQGDCRQFVANRVEKIRQHGDVIWHQVPSSENPADIGSQGGKVNANRLWQKGPKWLSNRNEWPVQRVLEPTPDSQSETKVAKEIFKAAVVVDDMLDRLLEKYSLPKVLRIGAWIHRFISNCRRKTREREFGPINSRAVTQQREWWIRRAHNWHKAAKDDVRFQADEERLNLQENNLEILECRGRIVGEYPVYVPDFHLFTSRLVREAHLSTLHGKVAMTMTKVREHYWVPRLRSLVKKIRSGCHGCKRFRATAYQARLLETYRPRERKALHHSR